MIRVLDLHVYISVKLGYDKKPGFDLLLGLTLRYNFPSYLFSITCVSLWDLESPEVNVSGLNNLF